ncbi:hypothetical protein ABEB36_006737 [Hypothenemus hampei]|uniref:Carboxylic ester hydrolase n=1 Tax=Hypothenemus hampei TaxID=57062 RepID=A0ABD1ERK3_HYPHA
MFLYLNVLLLIGFLGPLALGDILVATPKGTVRGRELLSPGNRTFYGFTGIPYAKPPVGELRFQAPVEADQWEGVINATQDPNECFQVNSDSERENENCLFVNVFTPTLNVSAKLPVVLGIYGGSFRSGSAGYGRGGPDWFVERDIVIVSFNYRIGPFGFLSTNDIAIPGNAGLKDQQLALKWTYDNIAQFGGDPKHITLQGQSAGGASVTFQLLNLRNEGLIKAALVESGSAICPWAYLSGPNNLNYAQRLATVVNNNSSLGNNSGEFIKEFLQGVEARNIDAASAILYSQGIPLPTLEVEHDGAFLTQSMYEQLEAGQILKVPIFIGINSEEYISLAGNLENLQNIAKRYDSDNLKLVPRQFSGSNATLAAKLIKEAYVGSDTFSNKLGAMVQFYSDSSFTKSIIRFAELYSHFSPAVYFYQFSYKGPMGIYEYAIDGADNVAHGEEGHYMSITKAGSFDNTDYTKFPASDVTTHWRLIELWSNFYKYGNPTPTPVDLLENITWPPATEDDPKGFVYLNINETLQLKYGPKSPKYEAWKEAFENYAQRPFVTY